MWRTLDHPNVLPFYGVTYIGRHLYSVSLQSSIYRPDTNRVQVSPWMECGTSISFVQKFPQTDVLKLLSEISEGLAYLHSLGIIHGDLRGANVLISDGVARLSDFGLSNFLETVSGIRKPFLQITQDFSGAAQQKHVVSSATSRSSLGGARDHTRQADVQGIRHMVSRHDLLGAPHSPTTLQ